METKINKDEEIEREEIMICIDGKESKGMSCCSISINEMLKNKIKSK